MKSRKKPAWDGRLPFSTFIPDIRRRVIPANNKFRQLPKAEKERITISWITAFNTLYDIISGEKRKGRNISYPEIRRLTSSSSLSGIKQRAMQALDENDQRFFIELGNALQSPRDLGDFPYNRYVSHRVALFLLYWWISWQPEYPELSHQTRGLISFIVTHAYCPSNDTCHILPENRKFPGLCFLSYGALESACQFFLKDPSIKKAAIIKIIQRLGLSRCTNTKLVFSNVEPEGERVWLY